MFHLYLLGWRSQSSRRLSGCELHFGTSSLLSQLAIVNNSVKQSLYFQTFETFQLHFYPRNSIAFSQYRIKGPIKNGNNERFKDIQRDIQSDYLLEKSIYKVNFQSQKHHLYLFTFYQPK